MDFGLDYVFYNINSDTLLPNENELFENKKKYPLVLLINYFGLIDLDSIVVKIKKRSGLVVILDNVQNYFGYKDNKIADYSFTSFRKWFSVPDGADVFTQEKNLIYPNKNNIFAQYKFAGNVLKNFSDVISDSLSLELIKKGEDLLDIDYRCSCSAITKVLINKINFNNISIKRKRNAAFLHSELDKLGIKHLYIRNTVPLFIPIFLQNRDSLRKKMFRENIFTPVHWPYEKSNLNGDIHNDLYETELSLICDQRYNLKDMSRMLEVLKSGY